MKQSIAAVLWGIFLALGVGALVVFGIAAPVLTRFVGADLASTALPAVLVIFAAGFAFYWGGMIAAYRAPSRRRLHGVLVGVTSFAISPLINLGVSAVTANGNDPFANLRTPGLAFLTGIVFVAVIAGSYIGSRRGETLYAHNRRAIQARERVERNRQGASETSRPAGRDS